MTPNNRAGNLSILALVCCECLYFASFFLLPSIMFPSSLKVLRVSVEQTFQSPESLPGGSLCPVYKCLWEAQALPYPYQFCPALKSSVLFLFLYACLTIQRFSVASQGPIVFLIGNTRVSSLLRLAYIPCEHFQRLPQM